MKFGGEQIRKVTLIKKTITYGDHNQEIETWAADTSLFASGEMYVEWWDQGGKEMVEGGQLVANKDIRAKCRFISALNESDYRIRKDGIDYDIESIKEMGRREGQLLILKAFDNQVNNG